MVLDTLSGRSPLYRLDEFFESQDTELLLDKKLELSSFSDHNVARVMDKAYETGTIKIFRNIAANAVSVFGINTEHVSFNTTSVSVEGDYDLYGIEENTAIDIKTRLFLSLANGVGAGRMRQATRELVKAYSIGVYAAEFDELFAMFAWNQGVGYFASEIGPSSLFAAYQFIKVQEDKEINRSEIVKKLTEKFGEKNPDVSTFYQETKGK